LFPDLKLKRKTIEREDGILTQGAKQHDDLDIGHLAEVDVSPSTPPRRLKLIDLLSGILHRKKPFLTAKQKRNRLKWARNIRIGQEDWKHVILSDESSIVLGRKSRRRRYGKGTLI